MGRSKRAVCFGLGLLAGCGRIGFDPLADADGSLTLSGPSLTAARRCTGPFTVELADDAGASETATIATTIDLSGGMTGTFFTDGGCTTATSSVAIAVGASSATFYYANKLAEQPVVTATATLRAPASHAVSIRMIAAGDSHTCVAYDGTLACWGRGNEGQLGTNGTANAMVPESVPSFTGGVVAVATGGQVTCAIVDGGAWCWGDNNTAQLGTGALGGNSLVPVRPQNLSTGVTAITTGDRHACALVGDAARCWGYNMEGEVGTGMITGYEPPRAVAGLDRDVEVITAGYDHTCVIVNGVAACWGHNDNGPGGSPLGYSSGAGSIAMYGTPVSNLSADVTWIEVAGFHTCALTRTGAAWCWGAQGGTFNLGDGTANDSTTPTRLAGFVDGVTDLALGQSNNPGNCAVHQGGAYCWGQNSSGNIGDGSSMDRDRPTAVMGLQSGVMAISTGEDHACTLLDDGRIACWGANSQGQLGDGTGTPSPTPVFAMALP